MSDSVSAFHDPSQFGFVATLEASFDAILAELRRLRPIDFVESPDALTTATDRYDERGWRTCDLVCDGALLDGNAVRCPHTIGACCAVPGLVHAGFSLFQPGTHLYPHRGERLDVLRCHLPMIVPTGNTGLRSGNETRTWQRARCVIFDDTLEHEAWNHGDGDRVVLLVTFKRPAR
jgi:beta-hydroxylase